MAAQPISRKSRLKFYRDVGHAERSYRDSLCRYCRPGLEYNLETSSVGKLWSSASSQFLVHEKSPSSF